MSGWATKSGDLEVEVRLPSKSDERVHQDQEVLEDEARQEHDSALALLRDNKYHEAKRGFQRVLTIELVESPFRSRVFRSAAKNLARCFESLGDYHRALEALLRAASFLENDTHDMALWFMIRRVARLACHIPAFRLADNVLRDKCSPQEYVPAIEPTSCSFYDDAQGVDRRFPRTVLIRFCTSQEYGWEDILVLLKSVDNDELVTLVESRKEVSIDSVDIFSSELETTEIPSVLSSPVNNYENKSSKNVEDRRESVSPTNSEGLKTPKPQSGIKRMRERLTRAAQLNQTKDDDDESEEETELIDPSDHLPEANSERSIELLQWFEERVRLMDSKESNNRVYPSPARSPIKEDSFPVTPQKEKDALKQVLSGLFSLYFPILGMDLLAQLFSLMYEYFESIPTKYIAEAYSLMVVRNVPLNEDHKWLGILCRADIDHSLAGLSAREIVTMDADMGDELWLIEKASHSTNVHLASRTFRRCAERALLMKRKLLVEIALDQLKNLGLPQDRGFILTVKDKLAKLSNNEELDTILEECAVDSPAFAKDPQECMRIVADACFMVSPRSNGPRRARPDVFAAYRLDVLKAGLGKEKETLVRLALEFVPPVELPETETAGVVDLAADGEATDEVAVFNYAEMEVILCRLFYTFPSLFSRSIVDLLDQSTGAKRLWNSIIPAAWIWAGFHGDDDEYTRYVQRLKALSCYEDFVDVAADDLVCMIHAMVEMNARRSVICAARSLQLWTETTRDFIENALSLCVYALEDKEVQTALEVSELLLHDTRLAKLFHEMRGPADVPFAMETITTKYKQKQDDGELDLEDEREKILADSASLLLSDESEELERLDWMMEQAPRLWEFLAPHMWCTNKTNQILTLTSKRDYLERRLLRAVSEAPVSKAIYEIHNGGIWFHLTRFGIGETEEEEDGSDGKEEKAADETANVMSDKTRTLHLWLERDLQVEPHRLSSLLELGKIFFQEEQRKRIEEQKKARLEKGASSKSSGDPEAAEVDEVKHIPRPDPATLKAKERLNARKYRTSLDCFAEIEKVLVRQGSQGVKTCALITWRGRWAIAARVSDGTVDLLTMDEQQARYEEMKERQAQYYRNSRLPHLSHTASEELDEETGEDNESSRFGLDKDSVDSPRPAKRSKKDSEGDERWSSRKAAARRQEVLRRIPIEEVSPLPLSAFQVPGVSETIRYMMCDVLPTELHKMRLDVSEYLILHDVIGRSEQYLLGHEEIERVQQCIEICEYANDDRAWSFYWFKGYVESDLHAFDRSANLAKKLALQIRKHGTKKQKTKAFCYMVGYVDASARACLIRLRECRGKPNEQEMREKLASELKTVHKEDKDNLLACRLLQELLGCDNDAIDAAFYIMKRWDSGSILFDHLRELDWEEEVAETFSARVEALSQRSDPLPGALSLLNYYFSKKLDKIVEKSDYDDLVNLILTKGVPGSTQMECLYQATVNFANKVPAIKRMCDARLQQLGEQEWGMTSFGEIMDECNKRFGKNAAKKGGGRKIFSRGGGGGSKHKTKEGETMEDNSKSNSALLISESSQSEDVVKRSISFSNSDAMDVENTTHANEEMDIFQ